MAGSGASGISPTASPTLERDSPARVTGERNFPRQGRGKRVFPPAGSREAGFSPNFESSLAFQRRCGSGSLHRHGRRSPDGLRRGGREADFSGSPRPLSESEIFAGAGRRGSPAPGIFDREQVFPPNFGIFPSLSKKLWMAGSFQGHRLRKFPSRGAGLPCQGPQKFSNGRSPGSGIVPRTVTENSAGVAGSRFFLECWNLPSPFKEAVDPTKPRCPAECREAGFSESPGLPPLPGCGERDSPPGAERIFAGSGFQ